MTCSPLACLYTSHSPSSTVEAVGLPVPVKSSGGPGLGTTAGA
jgi:hypothetical protein